MEVSSGPGLWLILLNFVPVLLVLGALCLAVLVVMALVRLVQAQQRTAAAVERIATSLQHLGR